MRALACVVVWLAAAAAAGTLGIWPAMGGAAIALGVAVWVGDRDEATRLLAPSVRLVGVGVAAGAVMVGATYVVYPWVARVAPFVGADVAVLYAAFRAPSRVVAALALGPIVVGEELVWRGAVQGAVGKRFGAAAGVVIAAVVYGVAHAGIGSPVLCGVAVVCGGAWGALRAGSGSLVPGVVAHLVWDGVVLLGGMVGGR